MSLVTVSVFFEHVSALLYTVFTKRAEGSTYSCSRVTMTSSIVTAVTGNDDHQMPLLACRGLFDMTSILREHSAHGPLWLQEKIFSCLRLLLGLPISTLSLLDERASFLTKVASVSGRVRHRHPASRCQKDVCPFWAETLATSCEPAHW